MKKKSFKLLSELFWIFFKIGAFTFGSGFAMIALFEREVVDRKKWFEREDFINQFTLAQSAPGPFSLNAAVFVGYRMQGFIGSLISVLGLIIAPFVIILLIAVYLQNFRDIEVVNAAFKGLRPCVISLIAVPCIRMALQLNWLKLLMALAALLLIWLTGISAVWFLLGGALLGLFLALPWVSGSFKSPSKRQES